MKLCRGIRVLLQSVKRPNGPAAAQEASAAVATLASGGYTAFLSELVGHSDLPLAIAARTVLADDGKLASSRQDLFPLPSISRWPEAVDIKGLGQDSALACANVCVVALNHLEKGMQSTPAGTPRTAGTSAQAMVHQHICGRVVRFLGRLNDTLGSSFCYKGAFDKHERATKGSACEPVRGDAVDLPDKAASCDPSTLVDPDLWQAVRQAECVFPGVSAGETFGFPCSLGSERREYIKLTCRELRCGKLRLRRQVQGVAKVFAVPKSSKGRQLGWVMAF